MILFRLRQKKIYARPKFVSLLATTLISGLLVSIPAPANAAECVTTSKDQGNCKDKGEIMRKVLLLVLLFLNLSVLPSWAADECYHRPNVQRQKPKNLDIVIPDNVPPGFHSVEIEVYDESGTLSTQEIVFCKNLTGEVHWDNKCPDVTELWAYEDLMKIKEREELPAYSPAQEPEKSKDLAVAAFAALAALTVAGSAKEKKSRDSEDQPEGEDKEQEDLASVDSGKLALIQRDPGRGDLSRTWQNPYTDESDYLFVTAAYKASGRSPLLARTLADGSYLRAILGSFAGFLYPIAALLGLAALINVGAQAMAPALANHFGNCGRWNSRCFRRLYSSCHLLPWRIHHWPHGKSSRTLNRGWLNGYLLCTSVTSKRGTSIAQISK